MDKKTIALKIIETKNLVMAIDLMLDHPLLPDLDWCEEDSWKWLRDKLESDAEFLREVHDGI